MIVNPPSFAAFSTTLTVDAGGSDIDTSTVMLPRDTFSPNFADTASIFISDAGSDVV